MIGTTISHYEVLEKLGEGGMGVVYKAQDMRLNRFVALKFLPHHVTGTEAEKTRFLQEAQAAAALSHANICTIHGIEEHEDQQFIVMEFVEGQTLQEKKPSLSLKQVLDIGIQIAEGLAAAHEKGIVHRDIKPENIMIRKDGTVQIMDFGLAKLRGASRLTKAGSAVGTAGYMSPEQIQGHETDHRSDIFSLGVLLFEMLSGEAPFKGLHETAVAYEIVNVDPRPLSSVKPEIPPELDAIILECLEKDPRERTQSAGQVALDLRRCRRESSRLRTSGVTTVRASEGARQRMDQASHPPAAKRPIKGLLPWAVSSVLALAGLLLGFGIASVSSSSPPRLPTIRASVKMPVGVQYLDALGGNSAISPDGSMIAFVGIDSLSQQMMWVRPLESEESRMLPGTEHAGYPFWSHDSKSIGFFSDGKLKTIAAIGGPVLTLAEAPFGRGAAWSNKGTIIFAPSVTATNLYAVPASGGPVQAATSFDSSAQAVPRFPFFLPDGDHFVFSLLALEGDNTSEVFVGSLETRESEKILDNAASAIYYPGYLLYLRQGILMAQPFDAETYRFQDKPVSLQGGVNAWTSRAKADYSTSENGILLHASGSGAQSSEFVWVDAKGTETPIIQAKNYMTPSLSPNGSKIAYTELNEHSGSDIWIYDMNRRVRTRFTFMGDDAAMLPVWSSDGSMIFFNGEPGSGKARIYGKSSDGSGEAELLAHGADNVAYFPEEVSPDGRYLLFAIRNESMSELATLDLQATQRPIPAVKLGINGRHARFSADGKWIVYQSDGSQESRVLVSEFGKRSGTWQVSPETGTSPVWAGNRLTYFSTRLSRYMSVEVSFSGGSPSFNTPQTLFPGTAGANVFVHGATKDGRRYLGLRPVSAGMNSHLSILVNWPSLAEAH